MKPDANVLRETAKVKLMELLDFADYQPRRQPEGRTTRAIIRGRAAELAEILIELNDARDN